MCADVDASYGGNKCSQVELQAAAKDGDPAGGDVAGVDGHAPSRPPLCAVASLELLPSRRGDRRHEESRNRHPVLRKGSPDCIPNFSHLDIRVPLSHHGGVG
jgi:hypothetical protein